MEERLIKNTEKAAPDTFSMLPHIGYLRVGEYQCLLLNLNNFIGIMYFAVANHQGDFGVVPSFAGYRLCLVSHKRLQPEHIQMSDFIMDILRYPIEFSLIELLYIFNFFHIVNSQISNISYGFLKLFLWY
jgi:hypothetical protein